MADLDLVHNPHTAHGDLTRHYDENERPPSMSTVHYHSVKLPDDGK